MTRETQGLRRLALVALLTCMVGCGFVQERRLRGRWQSEGAPQRTLDLYADNTYSLRLSGKSLGFVSNLLGPEKGSWRVQGAALVLTYRQSAGAESIRRWSINELRSQQVVLASERWNRVQD
jgi:hypothetical protein